MRLREPWLVAIAAAFAALLLTRADFVPLFDGRIYANCIVDAALAHLSPFNLQCAGHPDYAFMLFMSVPQLLAPSSFIPMLLAGVALGVLAIGAFYATLAALFPGASHRVERLLLTAALAFNPVVVVSFLNPNPDNAVLAFFLLATWASVAGREVALILSGLVLCFCKESGALLYALLLALHVVSNASRIDGGPADKLRALRPAIRLSLPLLVFAAVLTARTVFAQRVLWQGEGVGPVVVQLLSFRIDDPVFHAYLAGAFQSERQRKVALIEPAAQLRIEEVDAGGLDLDEHLARSGRRQRQVLDHHSFRTTAGVNTNRFHRCDSGFFSVIGCTA